MKTLWLGIHTNEALNKDILAHGGKFMSGKVAESCLLEGFDAIMTEKLDTVNSFRYPPFPKGPLVVSRTAWSRTEGTQDVSVRYLNLPYLSIPSRERALVKEAKRWCKSVPKDEPICVFIYSMHSPFMKAASAIKKMRPDAKIAMLVLDLPQFMDLHMSRLKKMLKNMDWKKIRKLMKNVDKYILYSRHMADFLELKDGTWTVMEGAYDASLLVEDKDVQKDESKISVMYSGVLDLRYGVRELLDAMELLDDRYELWLTGNGNAVSLIRERAEKDERIQFMGYLPSRYDLLKKQREATMLISTRDPSEEASAYCFPSKIFEYMVSGNPVISTEIRGIPEEYFKYLIPLRTIAPKEIADTVKQVSKMEEGARRALGECGRQYILKEKNNVAQAKNMIDFMIK